MVRIVCAAVKQGARVHRGWKHDEIMDVLRFEPKGTRGITCGFLTNNRVFVNRHEAGRIALAAGQVTKAELDLVVGQLHSGMIRIEEEFIYENETT